MPERFNDQFWVRLDQLLESSEVVVDRPRDSAHPEYKNMIYPLDYGYLAGTMTADGGGIDVWLGSSGERNAVGVAVTVDLEKRDTEIKILLGCSDEEMRTVARFLNDAGMGCLLVRR